MINDRIKGYTKDNPYRLAWRCDFDPTLHTVCIINGEDRKPDELTEAEQLEIEAEYGYLKSMEEFVSRWPFVHPLTPSMKDIFLSEDGKKSKWFDVVNEAYPNPDGETYTFGIYFMLDDGIPIDIGWEGNDGILSSDGLFQFDDCWIPMWTRALEDGQVVKDYRVL